MSQIVPIGGVQDDRLRVLNDLGSGRHYSLIRTPLSMADTSGSGNRLRVTPITPTLDFAWNSEIPFGRNDGALWAGRGANVAVSGGTRLDRGIATLVIDPEITWSQNLVLQTLPSPNPNRSPYASPWHSGLYSADLPLRFGNQSYSQITLGQSALEFQKYGAVLGFTTEDQWWGPGIENALVMSNNAPGIPSGYLRTAHPIQTPLGEIEARGMLGGLIESTFFDYDGSNNLRSLSGGVVTLRTAFDSGLTVGVARVVYAPVPNPLSLLKHWADVLIAWPHNTDSLARPAHPKEQLGSLFARWVFPQSGFEVYGEWAKIVPPSSMREFLVDPQSTQGFTVGLQWARPVRDQSLFRIQTEAAMLEQTPQTPGAAIPSFYTSHVVPQGYTMQGQLVGAFIGPGGSSQWFAADWLAKRWQLGVEAGRIRWENEAYYRQPTGIAHFAHDVSLLGGFRGALNTSWGAASAELLETHRLNYLFQTPDPYGFNSTFDLSNTTLRLTFSPRW